MTHFYPLVQWQIMHAVAILPWWPVLPALADDTRVTKPVKEENDAEELQMDLENLYLRQEENNMLFNGNKFLLEEIP